MGRQEQGKNIPFVHAPVLEQCRGEALQAVFHFFAFAASWISEVEGWTPHCLM